jgi:hypothetical protein
MNFASVKNKAVCLEAAIYSQAILIPLTPMWVLATVSAHTRGKLYYPIDIRGNFSVSEKSRKTL